MKQFRAKLVVVSDLLTMFAKDLQIDIDEMHWLIKEISKALKRLAAQALIIVSMPHNIPQYADALLRIFDNRIDIVASANSLNCMKVYMNNFHYHTTQAVTMQEKDIQLVAVEASAR
jgi:hypothetical protein